ncbi:MAG: hypothetical protein NVS9B4_00430 [Candidatus Acidiferrum sp.]
MSTQPALIDEFGELDRQVAAFRPTLDRRLALAAEIQNWFVDLGPEEAATLEGRLYTLQVSACAHQRKIVSMKKLFRRIGQSLFLNWCTFPLTAIDRLLTGADTSDLVIEARTGNRTIKAVARAAPKQRAA